MKKKSLVIYILIYFLILLSLAWMYQHDSKKKIEHVLRVESSPWLSTRQDNLVSIEARNTLGNLQNYSQESIFIYWSGYDFIGVSQMMPKGGIGTFRMPKTHWPEECTDLNIAWLDIPNKAGISEYHQHHRLASTSTDCEWFRVYNPAGLEDSRLRWFSEGRYAPRTELAVYPMSEFIPGKPNEVLFVDIKNGVPYQGEIKVERLNAPPDTMPQIGPANASGVTSLYITLDAPAKFKITAGSDVLNVTFSPKTDAFHVVADSYLMLEDTEMPHVRITPGGKPTDFIIDYYVDYAWIHRQIVPAIDLVLNIELDPGYQFNKSKVEEIVYARIRPVTGTESWVIPFIAKRSHPGYEGPAGGLWDFVREHQNMLLDTRGKELEREHESANREFSILFQDFVKLEKLDHFVQNKDALTDPYALYLDRYQYDYFYLLKEIEKIQKDNELQALYSIFSVSSVLQELLQKDLLPWDKTEENNNPQAGIPCLYRDECNQIRKYLLRNLGNAHHVKLKEIGNSEEADLPVFEKNKRKAMLHSMMMLFAWFTVGVVGFTAAARRIRNRLQTAYFEAAARGKKQGDIPSSPLLLKVLICALSLGLLVSFYMIISLL